MNISTPLHALGISICLGTSSCTSFYIAAPEHVTFRQAALAAKSRDVRAEDYWNLERSDSAGHETPQAASDEKRYVRPEKVCSEIRGAAFSRRTEDTVLGVVLSGLGAGTAIVGTSMVARTGHTGGYTATWATVTGVGAATLAIGIYYLLRGGEDRAAYWTTNGAIANIQGDYRALPMLPPPEGQNAQEAALNAKKLALDAQAAADEAANKAKDADAFLNLLLQYDLKQGPTPKPSDSTTNALQIADEAARKKNAQEEKIQRDRANFYQAYETKGNPPPSESDDVKAAMKAAKLAHDDATRLARDAANKANAAILAQNYLLAEQAAWNHCAAALGSLSTNDAATNQGIVTSIGASSTGLK